VTPVSPVPPAVTRPGRRSRPAPVARPAAPVLDIEVEEDQDGPLANAPNSSLDVTHGRAPRLTQALPDEEPLAGGARPDPSLVAGDLDVDWNGAYSVGDEAPGGDNPTPDQDVVELIGRSLGIEYADDEELEGGEEIVARDRKRWELDPASSEDWKERMK
jgi:hypothetical protein